MATTYYFQASNSFTTCDVAPSYDMNTTDGLGLVSATSSNLSFVESLTFDMNAAGLISTNTQTVSLPISAITAGAEFRYRIQQIDIGTCAVLNSSSYSSTYSTTGIKSDALSLTWTGSTGILRVSIELRRTGAPATPRVLDIDIDTNSYIIVATPAAPSANVSRRMYLVRDCWWMMPSGTTYMLNESTQVPAKNAGLYRSINETLGTSDSTYIQNGTTVGGSYYFRITNDHVIPDNIRIKIRAKYGAAGASNLTLNLYINGVVFSAVSTVTSGSTIADTETVVNLNDYQKRAILNGRKDNIYDFCYLEFSGATTTVQHARIYAVELYYENNDYEEYLNHYASSPGAFTFSLFPVVTAAINSNWVTDTGLPFSSGEVSPLLQQYASGVDADTRYIKCLHEPYLVTQDILPSAGASIANSFSVPSGYLTLYFDVSGVLEPYTQVNRANLYLRMSLPPSATVGNYRDSYEIHGYNSGSGNIFWGGGFTVEQSGFRTYTTELCWLKPDLYADVPRSGNISHPYYRTAESLRTLELRLFGAPSGAYLSAAELRIEAMNAKSLNLFTSGTWPNANLNLVVYNAFQSGIKYLYTAGKTPSSAVLNLHALGEPATIKSLNLYTLGLQPSATRDLYIKGGTWGIDNLPLVTYSAPRPSANKSLNLFTRATTASGTSNTLNTFIGCYYDPTNTLNLITSGSDVAKTATLSLHTFSNAYSYSVNSIVNLVAYNINASASKTQRLFIKNTGVPYSGTLPLIMGRAYEGLPGSVPLFVKAATPASATQNMFVNGNVRASSNLNFVISGKQVPFAYQNLYTHGF